MRLRSVSPGLAVLVLRRSRTSAEHAALLLVSHAANALMSADMCAGAPSQLTSHRRRPFSSFLSTRYSLTRKQPE